MERNNTSVLFNHTLDSNPMTPLDTQLAAYQILLQQQREQISPALGQLHQQIRHQLEALQ